MSVNCTLMLFSTIESLQTALYLTAKHNSVLYIIPLSPREILRAKPEGFPKGSGYISLYIPTWRSIREELILHIALSTGQYGKILPSWLRNTGDLNFNITMFSNCERTVLHFYTLYCTVHCTFIPCTALLNTVLHSTLYCTWSSFSATIPDMPPKATFWLELITALKSISDTFLYCTANSRSHIMVLSQTWSISCSV